MRLRPASATLLLAFSLIACGGTVESTVPSLPPSLAPTVAPTIAPTQAPTGTPTAAPTPDPTTDGEAGGELAEAVVAAFQADPFIAHIEQLGTVTTDTAPGVDVTANGSYDLDGDDVRATVEFGIGGRLSTIEIVVVGDTGYVRQDESAWQEVPRAEIADTLENMTRAIRLVQDPSQLRHLGTATIDGRELQHLVRADTIPYRPSTGGTGEYTVFDIYVEDDGTPVFARTEFTATDPNGIEAEGTTEFAFTAIGGPIEIVAPK